MKVLHIISSGGMYGAEAVILNLSRALNESHHSSIIGVFASSSNPNFQLHETALRENVESNLIPCNGQVDKSVITSIRNLVTQTGADIVHAHGYKADVYVYLALRRMAIPFIATCHSWFNHGPATMLYGAIDRLFLRKFAAVVAVSYEIQMKLLQSGVSKNKIHFIRNGIDFRPFVDPVPSLLKNKRGLTVGWVARLSNEKGPDIFLRAIVLVLAVYPDTQFVMVGDGPERNTLELLIDELGIKGNVSLIGRRDDMPSIYASLDIMVSSSRQEGLPMAILEGMASKLPLVATNVGYVPNVIQDNSNGILVPSENIKSLADAMIKLLQDEALRRCLGDAAKKRIESDFSADRMAADYMRVYRKVTGIDVSFVAESTDSLKQVER